MSQAEYERDGFFFADAFGLVLWCAECFHRPPPKKTTLVTGRLVFFLSEANRVKRSPVYFHVTKRKETRGQLKDLIATALIVVQERLRRTNCVGFSAARPSHHCNRNILFTEGRTQPNL